MVYAQPVVTGRRNPLLQSPAISIRYRPKHELQASVIDSETLPVEHRATTVGGEQSAPKIAVLEARIGAKLFSSHTNIRGSKMVA